MIVDNAFEYFLQYKWVIFLSISLLSTFARFINSLFQDYPQHDGYATLLNYCCWIISIDVFTSDWKIYFNYWLLQVLNTTGEV